jgi:penicillin-insensitive murein endopeptidase
VRTAWLPLVVCASCSTLGSVSDGTSLSYGSTSGGWLVDAARLPVRGDGYLIPPNWATRGLNYGTEELVSLIVRAARRVDRETGDGVRLYVADLSPRTGGASAWHRSHQTGRDADLIFFAKNDAGRPAPVPNQMLTYGADGGTAATDGTGKPIPRLWFDTERNWLLVRALVEDPVVDVQYLFISAALKQLLLDHARQLGEPADLVQRAEAVLQQPGDSLPHDDHLHLRIYCPASDRGMGCRERGPLRWHKKLYKYVPEEGMASAELTGLAMPIGSPFCQIVSQALFGSL